MDKKKTVLILCTENTARSQMAEGLLRNMAGERFEVLSAGTQPAEAVHPLAIKAMQEIGIDISGQYPKDIATYLGKTFIHYLFIVCSKANDTCPRIWPGMAVQENRIDWPMEDPAATAGSEEERLEAFRRVRDELQANLADWIDED